MITNPSIYSSLKYHSSCSILSEAILTETKETDSSVFWLTFHTIWWILLERDLNSVHTAAINMYKCDSNSVEDECHFFFDCNYYHNYSQNFICKVKDIYPNFESLENEEKLVLCMSNSLIKLTAKFICECFTERQKAIFN